ISLPVSLALLQPGRVLTRHTIGIAQMLMGALLIHLTGGRLETHFHVFGSLAFLAFYRDWRVLVSASAVVAADHFFRGLFWPSRFLAYSRSTPGAGWNMPVGSFSRTCSSFPPACWAWVRCTRWPCDRRSSKSPRRGSNK